MLKKRYLLNLNRYYIGDYWEACWMFLCLSAQQICLYSVRVKNLVLHNGKVCFDHNLSLLLLNSLSHIHTHTYITCLFHTRVTKWNTDMSHSNACLVSLLEFPILVNLQIATAGSHFCLHTTSFKRFSDDTCCLRI